MVTQSDDSIFNIVELNKDIAELKAQAKTIEESLTELQSNITNCNKNSLPELSNKIESIEKSFQNEKDSIIKELEEDIKIKTIEINTIKKQLEELDTNYHTKYDEIEQNATKITEFEEKSQELKDEITQYHNTVFTGDKSFKAQLEVLYKDYNLKYNEILKFNNRLFNNIKEKTNTKITKEEYEKLDENEQANYKAENDQYVKFEVRKSIQERINTLNNEFVSKYDDFKKNSNNALRENEEKNENLRKELKIMIEALVSGATTAGLAKSHEKAKNDHYDEIKIWKTTFQWCIFFMVTILLYITFKVEFQFSISGVIQRMFLIISVNFPFIWLAYLANKNINQNKRLYEEYLHKWAIAFSFDGMKREVFKS